MTINGMDTLISFFQGLVGPILTVAIICMGLYLLLFANDKDTIKTVKRILLALVIGTLIIYGHKTIVDLIQTFGKQGISN